MSNFFENFKPLDQYHDTESFSAFNILWDLGKEDDYWVGGKMHVDNLSRGYHGLLKQWWEYYHKIENKNKVLLVSEGYSCKKSFEELYPNWEFLTADKYYDIQSPPDIIADICENNSLPENQFDVVICQATFEHLYDPFSAIKNLNNSLVTGGSLFIHSHPPSFAYRSFPRDYFRFIKDWWYDIPIYIKSLFLCEFHMSNNEQVFSMYKKIMWF